MLGFGGIPALNSEIEKETNTFLTNRAGQSHGGRAGRRDS